MALVQQSDSTDKLALVVVVPAGTFAHYIDDDADFGTYIDADGFIPTSLSRQRNADKPTLAVDALQHVVRLIARMVLHPRRRHMGIGDRPLRRRHRILGRLLSHMGEVYQNARLVHDADEPLP